jgi:hypothetical protein
LQEVDLINLEEFERDDDPLRQAKTNRSLLEYYFSRTPSLLLFILQNYPAVDLITYLNADLFFFSRLDASFDEIANHSIAIIAHRFPAAFRNSRVAESGLTLEVIASGEDFAREGLYSCKCRRPNLNRRPQRE